jgi:hypothetical protein
LKRATTIRKFFAEGDIATKITADKVPNGMFWKKSSKKYTTSMTKIAANEFQRVDLTFVCLANIALLERDADGG